MKIIKTLTIIILSFISIVLFNKFQKLKKENLLLKQKISQKDKKIKSLKLKIEKLNKKPKIIIINELNNSKDFIPKQYDINCSILKLDKNKKNSTLEIIPKIEFNKKTKKLDKIILEYKTKF